MSRPPGERAALKSALRERHQRALTEIDSAIERLAAALLDYEGCAREMAELNPTVALTEPAALLRASPSMRRWLRDLPPEPSERGRRRMTLRCARERVESLGERNDG